MRIRFLLTVVIVLCSVYLVNAQHYDAGLLMNLLDEKDSVRLNEKLTKLESSTDEISIMLLSDYFMYRGIRTKADSLQKVAIRLYPKGKMAVRKSVEAIMAKNDVTIKESLLDSFRRDFPGEDMESAYCAMIYTMARSNETCEAAIKYFNLLKNKQMRLTYGFHLGANMAARKHKMAGQFLRSVMEEFSEENNMDMVQDKSLLNEIKYAYGKILYDEGLYEESLGYIKPVVVNSARKDVDGSIQYAMLLTKLEDFRNAFSIIDGLVKDGKGNLQLKKDLVFLYEKLNPEEDGQKLRVLIRR